jgi:hypothetical protein
VGLGGGIEAVEVIPLHQADQFDTVAGVGRIDAGQRGSERVRLVLVGHRIREVVTSGE